jgi:hypothetical protein
VCVTIIFAPLRPPPTRENKVFCAKKESPYIIPRGDLYEKIP